ncbi:MAG: S8 family serine peptidase [candidate division Zixibacteria bacterium]|nr:S8 family serine peptidase [candidate division Zixibacteria bacterium]
MRSKRNSLCTMVIVTLLTGMCIPAHAEHYYCRIGEKPLAVCDSIVTVKFSPLVPQPNAETFAQTVPGLDERYAPERVSRGFYVYHVDEGYNIDSLLGYLNVIPAVQFAFPAYRDSCGSVCILNDLFIICYKTDVTQQMMDSMANFYHVEQISGPMEYTGSRAMIASSFEGLNTLEIANRFYESGLVEYSQPAMFVPKPSSIDPNDPFFQYQYNLYNHGQTGGKPGIDIGVRKAWEITQGDQNVLIAIIDCGFIRIHEDLNSSRILWNSGYDFVGSTADSIVPDTDPSPGTLSAHGVACQGIISAQMNNTLGISGIAPGCSIIPIKAFDDDEYGSDNPTVYEGAIRHAINIAKAWKFPPMVISCSWGYPPYFYVDNIAKIIDTAAMYGIPIVFASGNQGSIGYLYESVSFPAYLENAIAVGAVRKTGERWSYSGSGEGLDVVAPSGFAWIDAGDLYTLDQPGEDGYNPAFVSCALTNEDYLCTFGGTSGAAPQVAATLALVRSRRPDIKSFNTLKMIINSSAVDGIGDSYDSVGWDPAYGYGLASAFRALLAVSRGDPNNDHTINMSDITYLINFLYKGGPAPVPDRLMGDVFCDGILNIHDIQYLINYLYKGGPAPIICFKY